MLFKHRDFKIYFTITLIRLFLSTRGTLSAFVGVLGFPLIFYLLFLCPHCFYSWSKPHRMLWSMRENIFSAFIRAGPNVFLSYAPLAGYLLVLWAGGSHRTWVEKGESIFFYLRSRCWESHSWFLRRSCYGEQTRHRKGGS